MPSPPPPSQYLTPSLARFSRRKTLVHSIQEGQAARVGEEVSDLAPFRSGQFAQASLDLGLRPETIVELPIGPEQLEGSAATVPGRFEAFHRFKRLNRLGPGSTGDPSRTPRVDSLLFVSLNLGVAGLGLLPKRLHATLGSALVGPLESYGRDPARVPEGTPRGRCRAAAGQFAGRPLQSLWQRRRSRTRDSQKESTAAATSRPCGRWRCDKRPRSCSSARCQPRSAAPKKDLIES